jgi:hypothetical protein
MIPVTSFKEVKIAWNNFNRLGAPGPGSSPALYKLRNEQWLVYCKVRDYFLYSTGAISLSELNWKWNQHLMNDIESASKFKN